MQTDFKIATHNTILINFDALARDTFTYFIKDCELYAIIPNIESSKDCVKLFKNAFIITLCNRIKNISLLDKKIIYIDSNTHIMPEQIKPKILNIIYEILNSMSLVYIVGTDNYDVFITNLQSRNKSNLYVFNQAYNLLISRNNLATAYKRLKTYLRQNGLIFLYDKYFKGATNKLIVMS